MIPLFTATLNNLSKVLELKVNYYTYLCMTIDYYISFIQLMRKGKQFHVKYLRLTCRMGQVYYMRFNGSVLIV